MNEAIVVALLGHTPNSISMAYGVTPWRELKRAVKKAMDSGKPALINAIIDENVGTESGRIGNLNPQSVVAKK